MAHRIVLLTAKYPFAPGEEFITPELPHWVRDDVELTIMPWESTDNRREVPEGIRVDTRLDQLRAAKFRSALAAQAFRGSCWRELAASIRAGKMKPGALWRVVVPSAAAELTARALADLARERGPIDVAYSYWFDYQTLGALRAKERGLVKKVISRAHRYDIYEDISVDARLPFKRWMAQRIDLLAPISQGGLTYMREVFGAPEATTVAHRLGVPIGEVLAPTPTDPGSIALLSVSTLTPVKRVPELAATIGELARRRPDRSILWSHAGSGPLKDQAEAAAAQLPANVTVRWLGQLDRASLAEVYETTPWNFIVNVSSSEGVPVSLMEAMERGIPVAATQVGATEELVAPAHGVLLPPHGSPAQWAAAIEEKLDNSLDPGWRQGFRHQVVSHWDESTNMRRFVDQVASLAS